MGQFPRSVRYLGTTLAIQLMLLINAVLDGIFSEQLGELLLCERTGKGNRGIVRGRCGGLAAKLQSFVFIAQFFVGLSDEAVNEGIVLQLLARLGVELN